jgi:DNA-binding response OmpR family regulator
VDPGKVLVVEDPLVRRLIDGILTRAGYSVVEAEPGHARKILADRAENIALLVTNIPEFFLDYAGSVALLYVCTTLEEQWVTRFARYRCLAKPFLPHELVDLTRELFQVSV